MKHTKKLALILIFVTLLSLSSAVSADEVSVTKKAEDVLVKYYQKSFEQQVQEINSDISEYSVVNRTIKTLEQQIVDELTESGYEAYNLSSTNYDLLEGRLKTSFDDMALNREGNYVILISGDESNSPSTEHNVASVPIVTPVPDTGSSSFSYTQDGETYTMRYVTITSDDAEGFYVSSIYPLNKIDTLADYAGDAFGALAWVGVDALAKGAPISTLVSLVSDWTTDDNYIVLDRDKMTVHSTTDWIRRYIQIWNNTSKTWHTVQCSSLAYSQARCCGYVKRVGELGSTWIDTGEKDFHTYSLYYNDSSMCKRRAVSAYKLGTKLHDCTGDIGFFFFDDDGISINQDGNPLFSHEEDLSYVLPLIQYE